MYVLEAPEGPLKVLHGVIVVIMPGAALCPNQAGSRALPQTARCVLDVYRM
jgi:hypothetical protein